MLQSPASVSYKSPPGRMESEKAKVE